MLFEKCDTPCDTHGPKPRIILRKNIFYYMIELPYVNGKRRFFRKSLHNYIDNCIVGMSLQSLLILFVHLLTQVRSINHDEHFNLNVARLFNIVDATNQLNGFGYAFLYRRSHVKCAEQTAQSKSNTRTTVSKIVQQLGIMSNEATTNTSRELVRQEFKKITGRYLL